MKILVIDDSARHQEAAREQLTDHDLTVAGGYKQAAKLLGQKSFRSADQSEHGFDAVLTDMKLPMDDTNLGAGVHTPGELVPYGYLLALLAAKGGADYVGLVTDTNHHDGAISASLDLIDAQLERAEGERRGTVDTEYVEANFTINSADALFVHAPLQENEDVESVKDWAQVLWWLTATDAEREKRKKERQKDFDPSAAF